MPDIDFREEYAELQQLVMKLHKQLAAKETELSNAKKQIEVLIRQGGKLLDQLAEAESRQADKALPVWAL